MRARLSADEGRVPHAYQDSLGYWTIGVGHLIDQRKGGKLPEHIIDALLDHDIDTHAEELYRAAPWVRDLPDVYRAVLVNMAFQLGVDGLMQFKRSLGFMKAGDYKAAADAFLQSKAAQQTPNRWARHAKQLRTGVWQ
ncbi:MAG: glycoside hydrolase family protein [Xanthomonadales bacterium]|nr:glycoside hydrolase family protein [Xanthomonadales bacterium]